MTEFHAGFALVIGVGGDLPATVQDAEAMAEILRSPEHCAFPAEQVELLAGKEADRAGVLAGLDWLAEAVAREDNATAIVYFSGHGVDGSPAHLLTHGYDLGRLTETAVSSVELTARLRAIRSRRLLVLLDCCHAGAQAEAKAPLPKAPIPIEAVETFKEGRGRVVIASSRGDEYSYVGDGVSYFTEALREALSGHGASELDGFSRVLDLAMYASQVVPYRTYDRQHPLIKVSNLEDNFPLAYYAAGSRERNLLAKGRRPETGGDGHPAAHLANWQEQLDEVRGQELELEERLREHRGQPAEAQLERQRQDVRSRLLELSGKLGLLPQQSERNRSLTTVWTLAGLLSFGFAYAVWARTQNWPQLPFTPAYDEYGRYAVAVIGILYGLPLVALMIALTSFYQDHRLERGLLNRLPIALNLPFYADSRPRRLYQAVILFLFLLFPLAGQGHFFLKMCRGTVYERVSGEKIASGIEHFDYFPFSHAFQDDRDFYRLDSRGGPGSVTFYPFWQPVTFLLLELLLFAAAVRLFWRMARASPTGERTEEAGPRRRSLAPREVLL